MPDLNRRIRLTIRAAPVRSIDGTTSPGAITTDVNLWCQRQDLGSSEDLTADGTGTVVTAFANYIIRYREDVASTPDTRMRIYDDFGREFYIRRVAELPGERRRFLNIEAGHTS